MRSPVLRARSRGGRGLGAGGTSIPTRPLFPPHLPRSSPPAPCPPPARSMCCILEGQGVSWGAVGGKGFRLMLGVGRLKALCTRKAVCGTSRTFKVT